MEGSLAEISFPFRQKRPSFHLNQKKTRLEENFGNFVIERILIKIKDARWLKDSLDAEGKGLLKTKLKYITRLGCIIFHESKRDGIYEFSTAHVFPASRRDGGWRNVLISRKSILVYEDNPDLCHSS